MKDADDADAILGKFRELIFPWFGSRVIIYISCFVLMVIVCCFHGDNIVVFVWHVPATRARNFTLFQRPVVSVVKRETQ